MAEILMSCIVDLRSDTVTKPNLAMRQKMFDAPLGDDVENEDPTVNELQEKMAKITGKESALYVASGTMGNLLSVLAHCSCRGSEVVMGDQSHVFYYEQGNIAQFGGVQSQLIPNNADGTFDINKIYVKSTKDDFHYTTTELILIENTHNRAGGKVLPISWIKEVTKFAKENGVSVHMDGARIFNASIKSGLSVSEILEDIDSAQICFSKGLGAPVGSIIVGSHDFIQRVNNLRKAIGGGWRQAGVIAAGAIYALENNVERISIDHANAQLLKEGINNLKSPHIRVDDDVHTNIVLIELSGISPDNFCDKLTQPTKEEIACNKNIVVKSFTHDTTVMRLVTHLDIDEKDIKATILKISMVAKELFDS